MTNKLNHIITNWNRIDNYNISWGSRYYKIIQKQVINNIGNPTILKRLDLVLKNQESYYKKTHDAINNL